MKKRDIKLLLLTSFIASTVVVDVLLMPTYAEKSNKILDKPSAESEVSVDSQETSSDELENKGELITEEVSNKNNDTQALETKEEKKLIKPFIANNNIVTNDVQSFTSTLSLTNVNNLPHTLSNIVVLDSDYLKLMPLDNYALYGVVDNPTTLLDNGKLALEVIRGKIQFYNAAEVKGLNIQPNVMFKHSLAKTNNKDLQIKSKLAIKDGIDKNIPIEKLKQNSVSTIGIMALNDLTIDEARNLYGESLTHYDELFTFENKTYLFYGSMSSRGSAVHTSRNGKSACISTPAYMNNAELKVNSSFLNAKGQPATEINSNENMSYYVETFEPSNLTSFIWNANKNIVLDFGSKVEVKDMPKLIIKDDKNKYQQVAPLNYTTEGNLLKLSLEANTTLNLQKDSKLQLVVPVKYTHTKEVQTIKPSIVLDEGIFTLNEHDYGSIPNGHELFKVLVGTRSSVALNKLLPSKINVCAIESGNPTNVISKVITSEGYEGDSYHHMAPVWDRGWNLAKITVNGNEVKEIPKEYSNTDLDITYHLEKRELSTVTVQVVKEDGSVITSLPSVSGYVGDKYPHETPEWDEENYDFIRIEINDKLIPESAIPTTYPAGGATISYVVSPKIREMTVIVRDITNPDEPIELLKDISSGPHGEEYQHIRPNWDSVKYALVSKPIIPKTFGTENNVIMYDLMEKEQTTITTELMKTNGDILSSVKVKGYVDSSYTHTKPSWDTNILDFINVTVNGNKSDVPVKFTETNQTIRYLVQDRNTTINLTIKDDNNNKIQDLKFTGIPSTRFNSKEIPKIDNKYTLEKILVDGDEAELPKVFPNDNMNVEIIVRERLRTEIKTFVKDKEDNVLSFYQTFGREGDKYRHNKPRISDEFTIIDLTVNGESDVDIPASYGESSYEIVYRVEGPTLQEIEELILEEKEDDTLLPRLYRKNTPPSEVKKNSVASTIPLVVGVGGTASGVSELLRRRLRRGKK